MSIDSLTGRLDAVMKESTDLCEALRETIALAHENLSRCKAHRDLILRLYLQDLESTEIRLDRSLSLDPGPGRPARDLGWPQAPGS